MFCVNELTNKSYKLFFLCRIGAAKFEDSENNVPRLSELNHLLSSATTNTPTTQFTSQQFLAMELRILQVFSWNIALPTAAHFNDFYLVDAVTADDFFEGQSLGCHATTTARSTVAKYVNYFLEISLQGLFAGDNIILTLFVLCAGLNS